ncbi:MAG: cysteine hydrolase family protein [Candidatus Thorarchaeota archaeon]|jgi:nicotinamidase-related amidase
MQIMSGKTALLIMDMQQGNFDESEPIVAGDRLVLVTKSMIQKARDVNVPIIYVLNDGGPDAIDESGELGWEIHSDIKPEPDDILVEKKTPDAFHGTELKEILDGKGIQRLVILGLQTEYCVDTTCRRGSLLGYKIQLVMDGHSTWNSDLLSAEQIISHHNAVLGGWFVEVVSSTTYEFEE